MLVTLDKSLYCSVSISPPVKRTQILINLPKFGRATKMQNYILKDIVNHKVLN